MRFHLNAAVLAAIAMTTCLMPGASFGQAEQTPPAAPEANAPVPPGGPGEAVPVPVLPAPPGNLSRPGMGGADCERGARPGVGA